MDQYYRIAGLTVKMDAFGITRDLAQPYGIDSCSQADITIEADLREMKALYPHVADEVFEYIVTGKDFYAKLTDFDGMMLHASAIAVDGKAYLFSADSGVGKSTHTKLWQQVFGEEQVVIINDDKPALRLREGVWYVYGTPWSGKHTVNQNVCCPLAGICFLERGRTNTVEPCSKDDAVFRLLKQTYRPKDLRRADKVMLMVGSLLEKIPMWRMKCNMEPEAVQIARDAIEKGRIL